MSSICWRDLAWMLWGLPAVEGNPLPPRKNVPREISLFSIQLYCAALGGCFLLEVFLLVMRRWQEHGLTAGEPAAPSVLCYSKTQGVQLCSLAFSVGRHKWNIFVASSEVWCNSDWNNAMLGYLSARDLKFSHWSKCWAFLRSFLK